MAWRNRTFLMSDVQSSTWMWDRAPEAMSAALARHDAIVEQTVSAHGGRHIKARGEGDSTFNVFADAADAVRAAAEVQRALAEEPWPPPIEIRARMSLHVGPAEERRDDFYGPTVNRCARIRGAAHGGQVLLSQAVVDLLPPGIQLIDHGVHRLPDLTEPEHLRELVVEGLRADHPPLKTLDVSRHNLPQQNTSLVGRDDELEELTSVLAGQRLVTLTGPGGSGKTRLALQVAAELVPVHDDGTWFVPLASTRSPGAVVSAVVSAVGARVTEGDDPVAALVDHLRGDQALLVLDNCEHVLEAVADLTQTLLQGCPDLRILATSQAPLNLHGETVRTVPALPLPTSPELDAVASSHAVQLFLDRAHLVRPELELDATNAGAIARICERLDGVPLAIELAAARLRVATVEELDDLLDDRFRVLTGGPRSAPDRHRTMHAAIEWSYQLLDEEHQRLLHHLAAFVGTFTLDDATILLRGAGVDLDPFLGLAELTDRSLVSVVPASSGPLGHTLLQSIRDFAWQQLDEAAAAQIRDAHLGWVARMYDDDPPFMTRYRWDLLDDARAALRHGLTGSCLAEAAVLLPRIEAHLFHLGALAEARELLDRGLRRREELEPAARLELHTLLVDDCWILGDREASRRHAAEVTAMFDEVSDERIRSRAAVMLSKLAWRLGHTEGAMAWARRAVAAGRALESPAVVANALSGLVYSQREIDPAAAREHLAEAIAILEEVGSPRVVSLRVTEVLGSIGSGPAAAVATLRDLVAMSDDRVREHLNAELALALALHAVADPSARRLAEEVMEKAAASGDPGAELHAAAVVASTRHDPTDPDVVQERALLLDRWASGLNSVDGALVALADLAADDRPALAARLLLTARDRAAPPLPPAIVDIVADKLGPAYWPPVAKSPEPLRDLARAVATWIADGA